jgi:hypothetical protein
LQQVAERIGHCSDSERRGFAELRKSARLYACVEGFASIAVTPSEGQYSVRPRKFRRTEYASEISLESQGS